MNKNCDQCIWHDDCDEANPEECEYPTPYDTQDEDEEYYINTLRENQDEYASSVEDYADSSAISEFED